MKVSKWVDFGQEVEVDICAGDIRGALSEAFAVVTEDRIGEEGPNRNDVIYTLNSIGAFLKALTDEQIALLNENQRTTIAKFLSTHAERFQIGALFKPAHAVVATKREDDAGSSQMEGRLPDAATVSGQSS